jgi:hypothetical protein
VKQSYKVKRKSKIVQYDWFTEVALPSKIGKSKSHELGIMGSPRKLKEEDVENIDED